MLSRVISSLLVLTGLAIAAPGFAQATPDGSDQRPRFLFAPTTSSAPKPVDARALPALRIRLAVHFDNETVRNALDAVAAQTGLRFVYSGDVVAADRRVTLRAEDIALASVLTELFLGAGVDVVFAPSRQIALVARDAPRRGEVAGRVIDAITRGPVGGAEVEVVGRSLRAVADADGRFRLSGVPLGVISLRGSAVGYATRVETDVVVGAARATSVVLSLPPAPLVLSGIGTGSSYFASARETPTSTQRLNPEEIRRSPGAQEDVMRAVSHLPGVAPTPIHDNTLIVRGGAPFENLFVVDGLEVPNINHFSAQGSSGGFVSIVNLDLVRDVEFSAGGFGASNGDRIGSVTDLTLRESSTDRHLREVNLSATGFGAIVEGPVGRGSYAAALRRSYLDLILELSGESFVTRYWDANVKIVQRLGNRDALSWTFVGARDRWGAVGTGTLRLGWF